MEAAEAAAALAPHHYYHHTCVRAILNFFFCHNCLPLEADYTLDDSFWNEESPVGNVEKLGGAQSNVGNNENLIHAGEVERLLKEYRQNQELVRKIGGHFYQIIYPVQLRHHEKMGISTREVGGSKVWSSSYAKRNIHNSTVCHLSIIHHYRFFFCFFWFDHCALFVCVCHISLEKISHSRTIITIIVIVFPRLPIDIHTITFSLSGYK
jgi:hypothetical protein